MITVGVRRCKGDGVSCLGEAEGEGAAGEVGALGPAAAKLQCRKSAHLRHAVPDHSTLIEGRQP